MRKLKKTILILTFIFALSNLYGQKKGVIEISENVLLEWEIQDFEKDKHTFEYCLEEDFKYLCKIYLVFYLISDLPPMYGRSTSGMRTEPSA